MSASSTRGRTRAGRSRAARRSALPPARPLLRTVDEGEPVQLDGPTLGIAGERWIEPFLDANRPLLRRLRIEPSVETRDGLRLALAPGLRIGAIPLLSPATRRVAAGLLVEPRFRWSALGAVMGGVGFAAEPQLGGARLVPGSAREVPPWLLAAPVLRRIEGLLAHRRRGFVERFEHRSRPRGRVDWTAWARRDVPSGRWTRLPCHFPEPDDDPDLIAAVRWTLERLDDSLAPQVTGAGVEAHPGRLLRERIRTLQVELGPGESRRPAPWDEPASSGWLAEALEAMGWVSEERGLGGARTLDGLAWDLGVDELWEAWVSKFAARLAPHLGLVPEAGDRTRRPLHWQTRIASMGSLVPDVVLRGSDRVVLIDAKYKAHLQHLARRGWGGLSESVREQHRADLHQALAYASLSDVERVDTVLAYPRLARGEREPLEAVATTSAGRSRVRLVLSSLPFGFGSAKAQDEELRRWRAALAA